LAETRKAITSELVAEYNAIAAILLEDGAGAPRFGNISVMRSNAQVASQTGDFSTDGLHLVSSVVEIVSSLS